MSVVFTRLWQQLEAVESDANAAEEKQDSRIINKYIDKMFV